jgi:hypothetical protein
VDACSLLAYVFFKNKDGLASVAHVPPSLEVRSTSAFLSKDRNHSRQNVAQSTYHLNSRATGKSDEGGINRVIMPHSWPVNHLRAFIISVELF